MQDMVQIFNSLPFLQFESEGSFGRHYRFIGTNYKVILYTLHSDNELGWSTSYHKELFWSKGKPYATPSASASAPQNLRGWFNSSFEEVFESAEDQLREQLIWHIDLFK